MPEKVIANRYKLLEEKFRDTINTIYEAQDQTDNKTVTIKIFSEKVNYMSLERLFRFKREVERVSNATHENLLKIYEYGEYEGQSYLVTEHINGAKPVTDYIKQAQKIDQIADIILQICSGLAVAHEKGIIHQFINPSCILIFQNGKGPLAKLSSFGMGLLIDLAGIKEEEEIIRTFGYMSPEATGILRKPIDERSDIYSLGIIFYQLVTGRLPYEGKDTSTLIHQHIAQKPTPPSEINPSIPPVLEQIVMRLIAKDPLDRYQSVFGLYVDLQEYILRRKGGEESPSFEIARSDRAAQISFATRLIGREKELDTLQNLIAQTKQGKGSFALVYGSPGVGKSRLVDELRGYIHSIGGIFVGGKCYQYESITPFNVFSEAIDAYVLKIKRMGKTEQEDNIARMKKAVGALGGEVIKIAPTIVDLIGEQPELESLEAEKERVRFMITVSNFLLSLGSTQNPFIIFLDDLQWADEGSIELLEKLAESVTSLPIVVIASYRDTDVHESHPLVHAMDTMKEKNIHLTDILVKPFGIGGTARIVSEILMEDEKEILPLSKELHERTSGNAFFVLELLHSLVDQKIVYFKDNHYRYDLKKLGEASLPTNVVEVVLRRVDEISEENQKILAYASLMGREIEFEIISDLTDIPRETVIDAIEDGIKNQLLTRDITGRENVVFMHDRIREALYKHVSEDERVVLHGQIANLLEEKHKDNVEPVLFELAHHYAQAKNEEKTLEYSLRAGKKAQVAYANDQAIRFYNQAKTILERQGKTTTEEYVDLLENLGLVYKTAGKFDEALEVLEACEKLIPKEDTIRRAEVLSKEGDTLWEKGEGERATELLREALKSLGVRLPKSIVGVGLGLLKESVIQIFHTLLPNLFVRKEYKHDQKKAVIVRIVIRIAYFYYFTDIIKCLHLGMKFLNMGERMGPSRVLSNIYATHTVIWSGMPVAFRARRDGNLAVKVAQDLRDRAAEGGAYAYFAVSTYSNRNVEEAYAYALKSIELLKGVGEYWDMGIGLNFRDLAGMLVGKNLKEVLEDAEETIAIARNTNSPQMLGFGLYGKAYALALIGDERIRNEGIKSAQEAIEVLRRSQDKPNGLLARSFLALSYDRAGMYDEAIQMTEEVGHLFPKYNNKGGWILNLFPIGAQVYLDCIRYKPGLAEGEKQKYLERAKYFCRRASWRRNLFPYIRSHTDQVNGICHWLSGDKKKALEIWGKGIVYLRNHTKDTYRLASILLDEASFLLKDNPGDKKAREYLIEAKELFTQLAAKLDLERTNKLLRAISPEEEVVETRQALTLTRHLDSLLSVTEAIGSIFVLEDLLNKIVEQAMKVTGAERGFLLLSDEKDNALKEKVSRGLEEELSKLPFSYENYKLSLNMVLEVEKKGEGLFAGEDSTAYPQLSTELKEYKVKEAMCVPLKARKKPLGMIYLDNRLAGGTFGEDELELMKSFAVQASISIENAYLVSNLVEQERLKQEMELGRQIQLSLLPEETPQIKGFAIAGSMKPAKEIGGDYFDYITFAGEPDRIGVVVADVTGKGVDAGMVMGMTKSTIHALSDQNLTTRELILKLNGHLFKLLNRQKFISLVYAEYSAGDETLTWSGAGHEHIIVVRETPKGEPRVEVIMTGGIVLGVFDDIDSDIEQKSITLNKGDKVVLYTDGVTEARNEENEMFTLERFIEIIKQAPSLSAQKLLSHINEKIQHYIGDASQYDDITLVVMERE